VRGRLVAAEVAALTAWLGLAVVGHVHRIVPFVAYTALRARGVTTGPGGRPLLFGDLFHPGAARLALVLATAGFAAALVGLLVARATVRAAGGVAVAAAGIVVTANLASGPRRAGAQLTSRSTP